MRMIKTFFSHLCEVLESKGTPGNPHPRSALDVLEFKSSKPSIVRALYLISSKVSLISLWYISYHIS